MGPTYNSLLLKQLFFSCFIFLFLSFIFLLSLLFHIFSFFWCVSYFFLFLSFIFEKVFLFFHFLILYQRIRDDLKWLLIIFFFSLFDVNLLWCVFFSTLFVMFGFYITLFFLLLFIMFGCYIYIYKIKIK